MAEKTLAHINSDVTWEPSLLCAIKGGGPKQGMEGAMMVSFKRWIDSTTVTRMSGRHWTHLIKLMRGHVLLIGVI